MIRYELKIPAIVTYRDKGIVDVQLRPGIKVTLKEDDFVRCFKVLKDISTIEESHEQAQSDDCCQQDRD